MLAAAIVLIVAGVLIRAVVASELYWRSDARRRRAVVKGGSR